MKSMKIGFLLVIPRYPFGCFQIKHVFLYRHDAMGLKDLDYAEMAKKDKSYRTSCPVDKKTDFSIE